MNLGAIQEMDPKLSSFFSTPSQCITKDSEHFYLLISFFILTTTYSIFYYDLISLFPLFFSKPEVEIFDKKKRSPNKCVAYIFFTAFLRKAFYWPSSFFWDRNYFLEKLKTWFGTAFSMVKVRFEMKAKIGRWCLLPT